MALEGGCLDQVGIGLLYSPLCGMLCLLDMSLIFTLMQDDIFQSISYIGQVLSSRAGQREQTRVK